jgi:hypothetical protein
MRLDARDLIAQITIGHTRNLPARRTQGIEAQSFVSRSGPARFDRIASGRRPGAQVTKSASIKVILAILAGLTASALARFSNGPSAADTYTGGFLYWLGYSGFDFGVIAAGIIWFVMRNSPNRASIAATSLLSVTVLAAVIAMLGVIGK